MEWNLVEDPLGPGPVEVCQEIVKSGVGAETDRYKDCASFLLTGHYFITMRDWKTKRERMFRFEGWKLDTIVEKFQANEFEKVRADLNLRFGVPQKSDSTSASWQESVADIRVSCSTEEGATLVVAR